MPPYCCGGRRCAKDLHAPKDGGDGAYDKDTIYTTAAEYERPLTLKFYARHDWPYFNCTPEEIKKIRDKLDPDTSQVTARLTEIGSQSSSEIILRHKKIDHPTAQPMTENQIYGWYQDRAYRYLKRDRGIFVFPHENDPYIQKILNSKMDSTRD